MTTRLVRKTNRFRITAIIALCLLALVGVTSFALNRSGNGQKDPTAIAYEEDEDPARGRRLTHGHGQVSARHDRHDHLRAELRGNDLHQAGLRVRSRVLRPTHPRTSLSDARLAGERRRPADGVAPVVDELETAGKTAPTLVVFATYHPDRSFATDDYE